MTNNPELRPRLPRRAAADYIGQKQIHPRQLGRKRNKTKKKVKFHMVGNEAYYFIDDLDEYNKGRQTPLEIAMNYEHAKSTRSIVNLHEHPGMTYFIFHR